MPSKQALVLLKAFKPGQQYVEGRLPAKKNLYLLGYLIDEGLIAESRLPPEGDLAYPDGPHIYWISPRGLETLAKHRNDVCNKILSVVWAVFKYFVVYFIGLFTPRITSLVTRVPFIQHWLNLIG